MKKSYQATEEKLIKFLISKYEKSDTNEVSINKHELPNIGLPEQEIIRTIFLLKEDGMFDIIQKSTHNDFSVFWKLALKPCCVHYFEDKSKEQRKELKEWLWWGIPTILSIGALIVAIIAL